MNRSDSSQGGANNHIKKVTKWEIPQESTGAVLLTMPNIPNPLFGLNPRGLLGATEWNKMRSQCLHDADYKCEACGKALEPKHLQAHELYAYNYADGVARFQRCVCLCDTCHKGIHSGRTLSEYKDGLLSRERLLAIIENAYKLICRHNSTHRNSEPLRAYLSFRKCINDPDLHDDYLALEKKYGIEFYKEDVRRMADRRNWYLVVRGASFQPYSIEELALRYARAKRNRQRSNAFAYQPSYMREV